MKIAIWNHKGGVGKTTITAHIGFRAIDKNQSLNVLDFDTQHNTMSWLSNHAYSGEPFNKGNVDVSNDPNVLQSVKDCIIDCPPQYIQNIDLLKDVDVWLVPIDGRFSVDGCLGARDIIRNSSKDARIVVVVNKAIDTKHGRYERDEVVKLNIELFKMVIPQHEVVRRAEMMGVAAWDVPYGLRSTASQNLQLLADWVLSGCLSKGVYGFEEDRAGFVYARRGVVYG